MIRTIEVQNYRILKNIRQELLPFQILVGPNGAGKTTLLDVIHLLSDLLNVGLEGTMTIPGAVEKRSRVFEDLLWKGEGRSFKIAVEVDLPKRIRRLVKSGYDVVRYEIEIGSPRNKTEIQILHEKLWLKPEKGATRSERWLPDHKRTPKGWKKLISNVQQSGSDSIFSEITGYNAPFKFGTKTPALAKIPEDTDRFPTAIWLKDLFMEGVQVLHLNRLEMRHPCHPGKGFHFDPSGSNLPLVIQNLHKNHPQKYDHWLAHIQTALPDMESIEVVERPEDRFHYIVAVYNNGARVPSWVLSDGTLRLLALTIIAYLPPINRLFLIEEPENGIHPKAIETLYQSLSSVYNSQVIIATHSPVFLGIAKPCELLCLSRNDDGAAWIVRGDQHPILKEWQGVPNLDVLFASGVLG